MLMNIDDIVKTRIVTLSDFLDIQRLKEEMTETVYYSADQITVEVWNSTRLVALSPILRELRERYPNSLFDPGVF